LFLDLSKIEAGRMELHPEKCLIAETLPEVLSIILPLATAKKIRLESPLDGGLAVYADPIRLKQILYNLLSNAVKFTPEGGEISVTASLADGSVQLVVRDTGIGIPPGELEDIFNEFHQVGTSTRGVREGTGLGLAITKRLVEQHGGKIRVESEPGKGSQFFVLLPAPPAAPIPQLAETAGDERRLEASNPLVLIVDDEPVARELLVDYLYPAGYETIIASSSEEAIAMAVEHSPDAITLNMLTPGKTGWQTLSELKSDPRTASIPVILVSVIDRRKMGFAMGAAEYLLKPVAKDDLLGALGRHLSKPLDFEPTVLVVDDDPYDLQMMTELLQTAGYVPLPAAGGAEALRILSGLRPDAMLLDLLMPDVDGFEVIRQVRQNDDLRDLPIFVLTAKQLTEVDVETLRRETRDFFRKGVPWREELLRQVRQSIGSGGKSGQGGNRASRAAPAARGGAAEKGCG
jgi:CheY-like chemotaxis protein/anti-sigma regulatory factor (Ser/Thr protein kinase)